jgi:hypothetical protein
MLLVAIFPSMTFDRLSFHRELFVVEPDISKLFR